MRSEGRGEGDTEERKRRKKKKELPQKLMSATLVGGAWPRLLFLMDPAPGPALRSAPGRPRPRPSPGAAERAGASGLAVSAGLVPRPEETAGLPKSATGLAPLPKSLRFALLILLVHGLTIASLGEWKPTELEVDTGCCWELARPMALLRRLLLLLMLLVLEEVLPLLSLPVVLTVMEGRVLDEPASFWYGRCSRSCTSETTLPSLRLALSVSNDRATFSLLLLLALLLLASPDRPMTCWSTSVYE